MKRDVKEEHTLVLSFFRPSCVQKIDEREREVSSPSNRRISAYVRVVVLGPMGVELAGACTATTSRAPSLRS